MEVTAIKEANEIMKKEFYNKIITKQKKLRILFTDNRNKVIIELREQFGIRHNNKILHTA